MAKYRILIVDDHREIRRMLRAGLEASIEEVEVIDVPSGEEAILVISRYPIDLLITDYRLPGINGLELKERSEIRNPSIKMILITGLTEPKIRRQVANAGADAFFFKPIEVDDFIRTVQYLLGLAWPEPPSVLEDEELGEEPQTLSECLAGLREQVGALAAALLDERGEIIAQTGVLAEEASSETMLAALVTCSSAAMKVSQILGETSFQDLMFFAGHKYNFVVTNLNGSMVLWLVKEAEAWQDAMLSTWLAALRPAVQDLLKILTRMGVSLRGEEEQPVPEVEARLDQEIDVAKVIPELEAVFKRAERELRREEVDAFWDSLVSEEDLGDQISRADAISYEQAQQLGLAPDEE